MQQRGCPCGVCRRHPSLAAKVLLELASQLTGYVTDCMPLAVPACWTPRRRALRARLRNVLQHLARAVARRVLHVKQKAAAHDHHGVESLGMFNADACGATLLIVLRTPVHRVRPHPPHRRPYSVGHWCSSLARCALAITPQLKGSFRGVIGTSAEQTC